jgi:hypothetical protein
MPGFAPSARRRAATVLVAVLVALLPACGKNRVLVDVDVRSFMDPSELVNPYDAPPLVPLTVRLQPIAVDLVEGFSDFGQAESATLDVGVLYDNAVGTGTGRFTIYFASDTASLYTTTPVAVIDAVLQPATQTTGELQIQADPRLLDLFTSKEFWMGVDMEWTPQGTEPLQGNLTITDVHARVVSRVDLF